ncbi:MAG: G8 domain-containing protein [Psychroserpens sp.]|uniref:G8 domain-containing protein n=1 Tax=Psychroserpens sp. TaxID=2020870 RepID=UPI003CAFE516
MKQILQLSLLLFWSAIVMAQTTWTGSGGDTNWGNANNWSTNAVPTSTDDVIIPTGFTVTLNVTGNVRSIAIQGNSLFEMNTNFTFAQNSSFGSNTSVDWSAGTINGSGSTLNNQGEINLLTTANKQLSGATTLENEGVFNIASSGDLFLQSSGTVLSNFAGGVIDMQADAGNITTSTGLSELNNAGMIKKTTSDGEAQILVILNNNDGTIQVEQGIIGKLNNAI